jgi:N-acetylmuramoyl-L-alanine amidase
VLLGAVGYRTDLPLPVLVSAFQRRWRPGRVDGAADGDTLARLAAVAALHVGGALTGIDADGAARA